ncbi:MAG: hypothetical protein KA521_02670 [Crocinitomicaceae bacterium]|nr:hypothetical protein [Crocinitomicaceae bacterium]
MKLLKISIVALSLLFVQVSFGQKKNFGFFGKKFYLQVDGLFSSPVIYNFLNFAGFNDVASYGAKGNNLVEKNNWANYGYRISAGAVLKRNFGIGLELGTDYSKVAPNYSTSSHEMLSISTFSILPKIEIANESALLPMGLSHQFGIGMEWSSIADENYLFQKYNSFNSQLETVHYNQVTTSELPFGEINKIPSANRFVFMYDLTMRNPISKSLMITYGFKYTLKFASLNQEEKFANLLNYNDYLSEINFQRNMNVITFHLGLTFAF